MKKLFLLLLCLCLLVSGSALARAMTAGTYTKTVTGMFPDLVVEVTLSETAIEDVKVISSKETDTGIPALSQIPADILANQSIGIDAVAGATKTSEGIIEAVRQALTEAGADLAAFETKMDTAVQLAPSYYPTMGSFEVPAQWDESYEVVVVGSGFAGLAAAYASADAGADTLLVEKLSTVGGNSATNGGQYAAYTSRIAAELQKEFDLVPDTAEKHIEDTLKGGDMMGYPELVEVMVNGSPYFFDLLLDNGLQIRHTLARPGGHYGYRSYVTENQIGADITSIEYKMVQNTDCTVRTLTKMVEIYRTRDEANRVVGIKVATPDGYRNIEATKGVILATGGFSSNVAMREAQVPYLNADIPTTNITSASTGEGIYLAQAIGANTTQMSNIQRYPWADPNTGVLDTYAVWPFTGPSYGIFYVDSNGNRYVNEGDRRDVCANAAVNTGFPSTYALFTWDIVKGFALESELEQGIATQRIFKADTLEELAEKINAFPIKGAYPTVSAENLHYAIQRHNGFIERGVDEDFGKVMATTMYKIEEGPYYAMPQFPSVHHTMGGLIINPKTEVIDIYGQVIPGLYAAGEVTGGVHGTNRLGANADADSCTFGYLAGQYVATGKLPDWHPGK